MRGIGGILAQASSGNKKGWLLDNAEEFGLNQAYYAGEEDTGFGAGCISPSGNYLYFMDVSNDIYSIPLERKYDVGTGVDIANAGANKFVLTSIKSFTGERGIYVDPTDTHVYVVEDGNDTLYQFTMSSPGDVTTISATYKTMSIPPNSADIAFKTDGTKLYVAQYGEQIITEYDLSTAWDISTSTYVDEKDLTTYSVAIGGFDFSDDGYYLYVHEYTSGYPIQRYTLSTAWDISTVSLVSMQEVSTLASMIWGMQMVRDGNSNRLVASDPDYMRQISLNQDGSIPPGVNQQAFDDRNKHFGAYNAILAGGFWHPDGTYFYTFEYVSPYPIQQYTVGTAWDPTTLNLASLVEHNTSISMNYGGMYIIPDGTEIHCMDTDYVRIFPMSTPWDVSTIGTMVSVQLSSYSTALDYGLSYSLDGTYMLTSETSGFVNKFTLSTPFDPSSITAEQIQDIDAFIGDDSLTNVGTRQAYFNNDGTKLYAYFGNVGSYGVSFNNNEQGLYEFDLSTPYDLSTISRNAVIGLNMATNYYITGMYINSDGTKLSVFGTGASDQIFSHTYDWMALTNIRRTKY
jgi:DNA-binding beta-propeller fold protein YncE